MIHHSFSSLTRALMCCPARDFHPQGDRNSSSARRSDLLTERSGCLAFPTKGLSILGGVAIVEPYKLTRIPMDDHTLTVNRYDPATDCERTLDPVTAELKVEFAKLERERRAEALKAVDDAIGMACATTEPGSPFRNLSEAMAKIRRVLDALDHVCQIGIFGSPALVQQKKFWTAALNIHREALAKLIALLARSLRAIFRVPVFLDGPELSSYKHRLR
jgi:hypothetical protein